MNGIALGHWGIITWPDNEFRRNVLINEDGTFSTFNDATPAQLSCRYQPLPKPRRSYLLNDAGAKRTSP